VQDDWEKRAAERKEKNERGRLILNNWSVIDCRIENRSDTGAMLAIYHPMPLPDEFSIRFAAGDEAEVERVWQRGLSIGVRFKSPPALREKKISKLVRR
jgi:hypothetical protein